MSCQPGQYSACACVRACVRACVCALQLVSQGRHTELCLAGSRYFLRKLRKVKKAHGQVLACNEVRRLI